MEGQVSFSSSNVVTDGRWHNGGCCHGAWRPSRNNYLGTVVSPRGWASSLFRFPIRDKKVLPCCHGERFDRQISEFARKSLIIPFGWTWSLLEWRHLSFSPSRNSQHPAPYPHFQGVSSFSVAVTNHPGFDVVMCWRGLFLCLQWCFDPSRFWHVVLFRALNPNSLIFRRLQSLILLSRSTIMTYWH